jgi:fluoride exporter
MLSNIWWKLLLVGTGGFAGAVCRYGIQQTLSKRFRSVLPLGTLTVNLTGSLLLGWLWGHAAQGWGFLFLGTGFMGAYTTFSTMQWETDALLKQSSKLPAYLYIGLTYLGGVSLAMVGYLS